MAIVSIIMGIIMVCLLMKEGKVGCSGGCLLFVLVSLLALIGFVFLIIVGSGMS